MFPGLAGIFRTLILPVTWGLLHFIWQGALVALLLGGLLLILKRSRPQLRYLLSCTALLLMIVLPIVTALQHIQPLAVDESGLLLLGDETDLGLVQAETGAERALAESPITRPTEGDLATEPASDDRSRAVPWLVRTRLFTLLPGPDSFMIIFMLWFTGVIVFGFVHLLGWRRVHHLAHHGTSPLPENWSETVAELTARLHNVGRVRVVQSALAAVPTVIGWLRPVILVPVSAFTGLDPEHLRAILAHELAHVQRFDYLVNLLQVGAETVLFYHPAVWWVSRRIRRERELCCDDIAVALCGDRLLYARALLTLEELQPDPRPALAATGGSVTERIHRLLGGIPMSARHRTRPYLAGLVLVSTLLLGCSVLALEADATTRRADDQTAQASAVPPVPSVPPPASTAEVPAVPPPATWQGSEQEPWQGRWEIHTGENGVHLQLRYGPEGERESGWGTAIAENRFTGLEYSDRDEFELRAEAGTISFTGTFSRTQWGHEGAGTYTFSPNRDFPRSLERLGIGDVRDRHLLGYAMGGVTLEMVRGVQDQGYRDLDADEVMEMSIFKVTPAFIRELQQLGYRDLSFRSLVEFRIHGVTPEYIREMGRHGFELDERGLVEFRIHGVNPEFMREMAGLGYRDLGSRQLVEFRIHGVTPEFVRALSELDYSNLDARQLVEFRIHGVTPEFIRGLQRDGYEDLTPRRLVEYRIHGVSPEYAREMERSGVEGVDRDDLVEFRIHGVTPEFVSALAELGYTDLSGRDLIEFRIHGVSAEYVRGLNGMGFRNVPAEQLVKARIYGVSLEYIRYVREERGLTDLDLEEIIKLKKYNIIKP